jgi:hypothetical protein
MSVHQVRSARRKMRLRYGKATTRNLADAIAAEKRKAMREQAAKKKK